MEEATLCVATETSAVVSTASVIPDDSEAVSPPVTLTGCSEVEDICDVCCAFWELRSFPSVPVTAVTVAVLASFGDAKDAAELDVIPIGVMLEEAPDICTPSTD